MNLSADQLSGCACIICGRGDRPMLPLYVETPTSTMVFHCRTCDCSEAHARELVGSPESVTPAAESARPTTPQVP
jgi:hypothetical protein